MAKSFFERLTGSIRLRDDAPEGMSEKSPAIPPGRARTIRRSSEEPHPKVLHPISSEPVETGAVMPSEPAEEGQLTVDIYDDGASIMIQSTVAGVKPEDIDISLQEDTLTIRGSRRRSQEISDENFYYRELYWGSFSRSIILPEEVDFGRSQATMKNGLLTIKLPKKDRSEKKISVRAGD